MSVASVPILSAQQEGPIQAAEQTQKTQKQIRRYEELLAQDNLTPSLQAQIQTAKSICEATLLFQDREPYSMSKSLSDLDDEINMHWKYLHGSPSTFAVLIKDMPDLWHFLARCLNVDYGCSHEDLEVECWPTHAASHYGHYLRNLEGYNGWAKMCHGIAGDDKGMFARTLTLTVLAEACIDLTYALKQVQTAKERPSKRKPFAPLLASECRWKELAKKILDDKAHLPYIYPGVP